MKVIEKHLKEVINLLNLESLKNKQLLIDKLEYSLKVLIKHDKSGKNNKKFLLKPNELIKTGKYWGLSFGVWRKVVVYRLSSKNDSGRLQYAPIRKNSCGGIALSSCELYYGIVENWKTTKPNISKRKLIKAGASQFWLK